MSTHVTDLLVYCLWLSELGCRERGARVERSGSGTTCTPMKIIGFEPLLHLGGQPVDEGSPDARGCRVYHAGGN